MDLQIAINENRSISHVNISDLVLGDQIIESTANSSDHVVYMESNIVFWACIHGILLVAILSGNILTILAIRCSRKLRSIKSNVFIRSLAISDIFVAFTLPYHLAFYLGSGLGASKCLCLLRFFLIINACCASIWNLISIAVDRYIAIVYPLHYNRYMTKRVAYFIIGIGWTVSISVSIVPMFWNNWTEDTECEFDEVLHPWYLVGIVTPLFSTIWICMLLLYTRIWREAKRHLKQLRTSTCGMNEKSSDWKSVQVVLLIMGCFSICWLPYFIVACTQMFKVLGDSSPTIYRAAFSMAMANSSMNPIIYAWKNKNFRRAFVCLLHCRYPDLNEMSPIVGRSNKSKSQQDCPTINNNKLTTMQKRCNSIGSPLKNIVPPEPIGSPSSVKKSSIDDTRMRIEFLANSTTKIEMKFVTNESTAVVQDENIAATGY